MCFSAPMRNGSVGGSGNLRVWEVWYQWPFSDPALSESRAAQRVWPQRRFSDLPLAGSGGLSLGDKGSSGPAKAVSCSRLTPIAGQVVRVSGDIRIGEWLALKIQPIQLARQRSRRRPCLRSRVTVIGCPSCRRATFPGIAARPPCFFSDACASGFRYCDGQRDVGATPSDRR